MLGSLAIKPSGGGGGGGAVGSVIAGTSKSGRKRKLTALGDDMQYDMHIGPRHGGGGGEGDEEGGAARPKKTRQANLSKARVGVVLPGVVGFGAALAAVCWELRPGRRVRSHRITSR